MKEIARAKVGDTIIVIRKWNEVTPYAVHRLTKGGDYMQGDYVKTLEEAKEIMLKRAGIK